MEENLTKDDLGKLIPHREPFLFLDELTDIIKLKSATGIKTFTNNEYFFKGHFPGHPIVPGVILIESMAQTAGIVVSKKYEKYKDKSVLFMSVSKAKFRKPVYPNEKIHFHVKFLNSVKSVYKFSGEAFKDNIKVCESEFSAMITHK